MDRPAALPFRLGEWSVDPVLNRIARDGEVVKLEPRMMRLLLCFAERAGDIVSADDLLDHAWPGVIVTPDSVYQGVAALRRVLGDDAKEPRYIVTVPRQGYRMIARVNAALPADAGTEPTHVAIEATPPSTSTEKSRRPLWPSIASPTVSVAVLLVLGAIAFTAFRSSGAPEANPAFVATTTKSVAVLPFLDLTESMGEEVFADGMTEELIDKLIRIPGMRVPPPTASFWFKDKQMTVAEIANKLGVAYLLDGSVRKSGAMMRIAARLVRASDGFVVWSETYDRPTDDKLMVQDDIAGEVRKAIEATIDRPAVTPPATARPASSP